MAACVIQHTTTRDGRYDSELSWKSALPTGDLRAKILNLQFTVGSTGIDSVPDDDRPRLHPSKSLSRLPPEHTPAFKTRRRSDSSPSAPNVVASQKKSADAHHLDQLHNHLTPRDFDFLRLIGHGSFARVYQVRHRATSEICAMKVLPKPAQDPSSTRDPLAPLHAERAVLRALDSPFLLKLRYAFETERHMYLVTDYFAGGELFWHIQRDGRFSEERARFYVAELVLALEHLHERDIIYRDLKPENILLGVDGHLALCDFGFAKRDMSADARTRTFCGTAEYLAPELLRDERGYTRAADFWALGVLLFEMRCGWSPFYAEDAHGVYANVCTGKVRFPKGAFSEHGKAFVKGLLNRNVARRLGAQHGAAELKAHPWFDGLDWDALARKEVAPPFVPEPAGPPADAEVDLAPDTYIDDFDMAPEQDAVVELGSDALPMPALRESAMRGSVSSDVEK